ncbi:Protein of unknown function, partial [Gryllus bimaculatus]
MHFIKQCIIEGGEVPAAHRGPMIANPLSAAVNSLPRSQILTTPNSTLQKGVNEALQILFLLLRLKRQHLCDGLHTESIAATTYTLATTMTASAAAATTITTATGTEMMHLGGMLAGMHQPMPIHQIPVPFMAAGIPGLGWPVCPPAGKIPPQYECANHRISAGASASVTGTGFAVLHLHPSEELNWVSLESDSAAESSLLPTAGLLSMVLCGQLVSPHLQQASLHQSSQQPHSPLLHLLQQWPDEGHLS